MPIKDLMADHCTLGMVAVLIEPALFSAKLDSCASVGAVTETGAVFAFLIRLQSTHPPVRYESQHRAVH